MNGHGHNRGGRKSPGEAFFSGLILSIVFGILWRTTGLFFFIFPLLFAGIIPALEGLKRIRFNRRFDYGPSVNKELKLRKKKMKEISPEKRILQIAQEERGRVTPAVVALKSDLSLEKAEKMLGDMAKKGYATLHITTEGRVIYEFADFLPGRTQLDE